MSLKKALLVAAIFLVPSCGGDESKEQGVDEELQQRIEAENCCHCLTNEIVTSGGYWDYCFHGTAKQCTTALLKGAAISSYNVCFDQLCVGDCWFLTKE